MVGGSTQHQPPPREAPGKSGAGLPPLAYRWPMERPEPTPPPARGSCPRCGKPPGLRWTHFLPSNTRGRVLKCGACGGGYDLSDGCRIAGLMGGLLGLGPSILLFGRIVGVGHASTPSVVAATAVVIAGFAVGSALLTWVTLRLVPRP